MPMGIYSKGGKDMPQQFVLGLDIGTTSAKSVIFYLNGSVKSEAERSVTTIHPKLGWAEQCPLELEEAAIGAIYDAIDQASINSEEIVSIGFSTAMHSLICVSEDGNALSNALIWSDGRSNAQSEALLESGVGQQLFMNTGVPIHPMSPLIKLIWMKETGYEPYERADYFMSVKEYLLFKWFGVRMVDYAMASASGLFNPNTLQWEDMALKIAGIHESQLSKIVPPTEILSNLDSTIAKQMGISGNTPFVIGSADGQLANLGIGAILPGEVAITVGTSGAVRQVTKGVHINEKRETFCYAFTAKETIIGGATNNGGVTLQWLKELLNNEDDFASFIAKAEKVDPGSEGLIFLPYINGERAPIWDQQATGHFSGITISHKQEHFIRAVLEGITFNLYRIERALSKAAGEPNRIYVNGGLARSSFWLQMLADIFGKEVYVANTHHSSAWGAAWIALVATGLANTFEQIKENTQIGNPILPNKQINESYQQIYKNYIARANL